MFISLNKKILYTISIFLILTFTLFVITFYAVYGSKFVEDQRFASLSALQLNRKQQTIYNYKTNNTGRDMQSEQEVLAAGNSFDRITRLRFGLEKR